MERRRELGEIGAEDEPWETVDSEKQSEGFGGERVGGWVSPVVVIGEGTYCMEHWVWCINPPVVLCLVSGEECIEAGSEK